MSGNESIFIDANVFLFLINEHPRYAEFCESVLSDIEHGKKTGFTSTIVLNETLHKLMLAEISDRRGVSPKDALFLAKKEPESVRGLVRTWENLNNIFEIKNLKILGTDIVTLIKGAELSKRYGLLISDAMHVAVMQQYGIRKIVTFDRDFERVRELELLMP